MSIYKVKKGAIKKTTLKINQATVGETIETKVQRITQQKEPITDGAPLIYTDRKDGVLPEYNPRTDKMELAVEAMDSASKTHIAKRTERHKPKEDTTPAAQAASDQRKDGGTEPLQATTSKD